MAFPIGNQYAKGRLHTPEYKEKMRQMMLGNTNGFKKGKPSPRKGKKSRFPAWNKGLKMPDKQGIHAWNWIEDRTFARERHRLHTTVEWKNWRTQIFQRDLYICQECGKSGTYLEAHHIIPTREEPDRIYDTYNGITLCKRCHKKTIWKESQFAEKYFAIITKLKR